MWYKSNWWSLCFTAKFFTFQLTARIELLKEDSYVQKIVISNYSCFSIGPGWWGLGGGFLVGQ
jgi:hypothetical protein